MDEQLMIKDRKASSNLFLLFILFIPYILPYYVSMSIPSGILNLIKLGCSTLIFMAYFVRKRCHQSIKYSFNAIIFFLLWLGISTLVKQGDYVGYGLECIKILTPILLCAYACSINQYKFLQWIFRYYLIIVLINNIIMIVLHGSISTDVNVENQLNFLGLDNYMGSILIPALFLCLYYLCKYKTEPLRKIIIVSALFAFPVFYVGSATSMMAFIFCFALLIFLWNDNNPATTTLSYRRLIIVMIVLFVIITIVGSTFFSNFAQVYLGKTSTFSGRTTLWARSLLQIKDSPIFGYGFGKQAFAGIRFDYMALNESTTCHSSYLLLLLYGGIVLFVLFFRYLLASDFRISSMWGHSLSVRILVIGVIGILIYYIAEWNFDSIPLFLIISMLEIESVSTRIEYKRKKRRIRFGIR